ADDDAVPLQAGVVAQRLRDRHPALLVRNLIGGAGEEDPAGVPHRLRGDGGGAQRLGDPLELRGREDVEAAFLALRDHPTSRKFLAVLGRQEQPPLLVQAWRMSAKEHRHSPPAPRMAAAAASRPTPIPLRTTVPHIPPPSTRTASLDAPQAHERAVQKSGAEWENAAVDGPTTVNPRRESHVNRPGRTVSTQGLSVRPAPAWPGTA